ncbi:FAD-dependent oxidoreductase [Halioxenophilus aromaticivorans]|uniref:FAD-dependent oxidoreductase n=1 Tax=Halioxenophilus aromaticivorans TaxID=1306992 RepID=A0AAV3U1I9_9ALTE
MQHLSTDLIVVGSGAAGLAAAVAAAHRGLNVVLLEKDTTLGGATAWSGGWMWVPRNFLAKADGINEDLATVRSYLEHELGPRFNAERIDAFLNQAPMMAEFFHHNTHLQFDHGNGIADIHYQTPGAGVGGRSLIAKPMDGRALGADIAKLRTTMRETSFWGMPIQAGPDLWAFLNSTRNLKDFTHAALRLTRHGWDMLRYRRAMQLCNGVALVGRLAQSAFELGVTCYTDAPATQLHRQDGRVTGVQATTAQGSMNIEARCGVVLAAGGFPADVSRRQALFKRTPTGTEHWPLPPASCSGGGLNIAEAIGAKVDTDVYSAAAWAPVSLVPFADGSTGHFPHIIDRAKPGVIGVLANGKRFVNEADGYFDYVDAFVQQVPEGQEVCSWLVCSHAFQRRYGLGITRPFPLPLRHWIKRGYLKAGDTLAELAQQCGIDAQGLEQTVAEYNQHARNGEDPAFGRGNSPYNRKNGDPSHQPNPCVAPLEQGPFYAVKVVPGSFGTFAGLATNGQAQVLDNQGQVIPGLYAAGADMASIMGGHYPAGGINLGPAMTFGYVAGNHAADQTEANREQ